MDFKKFPVGDIFHGYMYRKSMSVEKMKDGAFALYYIRESHGPDPIRPEKIQKETPEPVDDSGVLNLGNDNVIETKPNL